MTVARSHLEGRAETECEEPHLIECDVRHLAELRAGRIQVGTRPLLAVEHVLRVESELPYAAAASAETALNRQVGEREGHAADAVDAEWKCARLERRRDLRRIALEACVGVEPALACWIIDRDVIEVAVKEDV